MGRGLAVGDALGGAGVAVGVAVAVAVAVGVGDGGGPQGLTGQVKISIDEIMAPPAS